MSLPADRRAINGRTWSSMYRETDYDPIDRPDFTEIGHKAATYLCVAIGLVMLAWMAATWGN